MTDAGNSALDRMRRRLLTPNAAVGLLGVVALVISVMAGTLVVRVVCGLVVIGAAAYFVAWRSTIRTEEGDEDTGKTVEEYSQSPEGPMKKLLFDDYQSSSSRYVVKELEEEREKVVPSSRTTLPAMSSLKAETIRQMEIPDFFDLDADTAYSETEPKSEFHSLVNKVLLVLKDVLFAHSVAFFWANREKGQMVLESMATDSDHFMSEKRFAIERDLVSQVALSGKPQVLGRVNPSSEKDLLRYYDSPTYVKSVLGVPVFYMDSARDIRPVGVIVADSKAEDAFGQETLELLGRFTKLVSALVKSYTDKYDLLLDSELLSSIRRLQDKVKSDPGEQTILNALADETHRLANWDYLTMAMFSDESRAWTLQKVVNRSGDAYVSPGQTVDVEGSIVGGVIATNRVASVADLTTETRPRYHGAEPAGKQGSFLCVPISSVNRCYGALAVESRRAGQFSGSEVETIYRLVENAAASLEVLYMNSVAKDFVAVDHLTGALTKKHFALTLEEEVRRADDFGNDLACVSIAIDGIGEHLVRYGREGCDVVLSEIAGLLRSNVRAYDALGRLEQDRLGVLLINTTASDAYVWAEKMRKLISSHVVTAGARSFSVTVSVGVCGLSEGMETADLMAGTTQVLADAMEHGGNLVRVY